MAFTIIKPENTDSVSPVTQQGDGLLGQALSAAQGLGRNVVRSGANLVTLPGEILESVQRNIAEPTRERLAAGMISSPDYSPEQRQQFAEQEKTRVAPEQPFPTIESLEKRGVPSSLLKPQGKVEEALDMTVRNLPFIYLFGPGGFFKKLGADFVGSLASKGAEALNIGPVGQFLANVAGTGFSHKALNAFTKGNPNTLINLARTAENTLAEQAQNLGENALLNAGDFKKSLRQVENQITKNVGLSVPQKTDLFTKIDDLLGSIKDGKISGSALDKANQQVNSLFRESKKVGGEYARAINSLKHDVIKPAEQALSVANKDWGKAINGYRDITKALNFGNTITNIVEDYPKIKAVVTSPLLQQLLGISAGSAVGGVPFGAAGALAVGAGRKAAEALPFLTQSNTTRKLFGDAVRYAVQDNIPMLTKTLVPLNKEAEKYEKKVKSGAIYNTPSSFEIIPPE